VPARCDHRTQARTLCQLRIGARRRGFPQLGPDRTELRSSSESLTMLARKIFERRDLFFHLVLDRFFDRIYFRSLTPHTHRLRRHVVDDGA